MIRTQGLSRWYGDFLALDHLDLHLERGDLFGFIGPNGAGKTTTMKILATLLDPSEGSATVGGIDVTADPRAVRRLVGYMPDFFGVYREMRVAEYLAFFASAYRVGRRERRRVVADLLDLVDLTHKREDTVGALSRGMQQRLGLARALVHDPDVLILDEPASGLDPRARVEVREILMELSSMGKTILLSSHILPELSSVCNRIGIIAQGRLMAQGSLEEVAAGVGPPSIHVKVGQTDSEGNPNGAMGPPKAAMELLEASLDAAVTWNEQEEALVVTSGASNQVVSADAVAKILVDAGIALLHLEPVQPSLEEVFLHLTHDHDLAAEQEEPA